MQDLVLRQEERPQTHLTQREIGLSREVHVDISETSVNKIVEFDFRLKCFEKRRALVLKESRKQASAIKTVSDALSRELRTDYDKHITIT